MRRFVTLAVLLLFSIPFGISVSGCSKGTPVVYCNGGSSGPIVVNASASGLAGGTLTIQTVPPPLGEL